MSSLAPAALHGADVGGTAWVWHSPLLWRALCGRVSGEHSTCGQTELCPDSIHFSLLLPDCVLFTCCCSSASACYVSHTVPKSARS